MKVYLCDRCGKKVDWHTGDEPSTRMKSGAGGLRLLLPARGKFENKEDCIEARPQDLCAPCVRALLTFLDAGMKGK